MTPRMLAARVADLTVTALAEEDLKFHAIHGPERTWSQQDRAEYEQLMASLFTTSTPQLWEAA